MVFNPLKDIFGRKTTPIDITLYFYDNNDNGKIYIQKGNEKILIDQRKLFYILSRCWKQPEK